MRNTRFLIALLTIFAILLLGCASAQEPVVTESPIEATLAPTATSLPPTTTSVPPTNTPQPTETPLPSPTPTATPSPVPFGAELQPGTFREVTEAELDIVRAGVLGRELQLQDLHHARIYRTSAGQLVMVGLPYLILFNDGPALYPVNNRTHTIPGDAKYARFDLFDDFMEAKTEGEWEPTGGLIIFLHSIHVGGEDLKSDPTSTESGFIIGAAVDEDLLPNTIVNIATESFDRVRGHFYSEYVSEALREFSGNYMENYLLVYTTYLNTIDPGGRRNTFLSFDHEPGNPRVMLIEENMFHVTYAP